MKKALPPTYFLFAIILMVLLGFIAPLRSVITMPWILTGILPLAIGLLLNVRADSQFKRAETTVKPFQESTALVSHDVFSFSRNPMYLGMASALIGIALLLGSITPWIVVLLFIVLMDRRFIQKEEAMLAQIFGAEFEKYRQSVRRWI